MIFFGLQSLFYYCLWAIGWTFRLFVKAIIFSPQLITGYFLTDCLLHKDDSLIAWVGLVILFAFTIYLLLYFFKGMLIGFRYYKNLLWIFLFLICFSYTCIIPVWIVFDMVETFMFKLSRLHAEMLTWIFSITFATYIYSRYHFLTDMAPRPVFPIYKMGVAIAIKLH